MDRQLDLMKAGRGEAAEGTGVDDMAKGAI
jgi:hypothetical protein